MGGFIAVSVLGLEAGSLAASVVAFAINMVVSTVITSLFAPDAPGAPAQQSQPNPGNRQQAPPAGDNKLPVVYGTAYVGGIVVDMSISSDNQNIYWVFALSEVTNTETGGTPDTITFGDIYWGGKKVIFNVNGYSVDSLLDESTGESQDIKGYMDIYLYRNGSNNPSNSGFTAISIMQTSGLIYQWDSSKLMSNCAFAIVHLKYSQSRNLVNLNQTRFQITNSRTKPGDCFLDYFSSTRYGAAIPLAQIDTASLDALNTYSNELITYTLYSGGTRTQSRFRFNGTLQTNLKIMQNIQNMSNCCDCLVRYNEITSKWGVIVQSPTYTSVLDINNTNTIGGITVTPIDISNTFNVIECKFPDGSEKDSFNSSTFDLAEIDPSLLFPNEPVNKQSVSLYLTNNDVTAQLLAVRMLKASREDLQIQIEITYIGLELEAGDIVRVTNANYGWTNKLFRIIKVTQKISDTAQITTQLFLCEFNPSVYSDADITSFTPSPNTGIGSPTTFGTVYPPVISNQYTTDINPSIILKIQTSSNGISEYAEVYYSAYQFPTDSQLIFAGTTAIQPDGSPYVVNTFMPDVQLFNIPSGNWYFFSRMVNNLANSHYSLASDLVEWRPSTFQYKEKYLIVAYADDINGTNISLSPTGKIYYGLHNQSTTASTLDPAVYDWYLADPNFGTNKYLTYVNRQNRRFSFDSGLADYAAGSGAFVPTQTTVFDPTIWSALPNGTNFIDLDIRTGQLLSTGTTSVGTGEIAITNNPDGKMVANLQQFLNFGPGVYTYTGSAATITIDIYGRIVGFTAPDNFYFTKQSFIATAGQTVFTPSPARAANYITGQDLVFVNGILYNPTLDYTENSTSITLNIGSTVGDIVTIISFRSVNSGGTAYASFSRNIVDLTSASSYDATGSFTLTSGNELLFLNGTVMPEQDYDIIGQVITNFPHAATGKMTVIQWANNNLGVPNGTPVNIALFTIVGQSTYSFSYDVNAFNLYNNGLLQLQGTDYTTGSGNYTLTTTPATISNILIQQTFARAGAA